MPFNVQKCNAIFFHRISNQIVLNYVINNISLSQIHRFKDLRVIFDSKLTLEAYILNRANRNWCFIGLHTHNINDSSSIKLSTISIDLKELNIRYSENCLSLIVNLFRDLIMIILIFPRNSTCLLSLLCMILMMYFIFTK